MTLPDWKNPQEYQFISVDHIGVEGVAWEFLRRNNEFKSDVQRVADGTVTDEAGNSSVKIKDVKFLHNKVTNGFFHPPRLAGETERAWLKRCLYSGPCPRILSPEKFIIKKWLLRDRLPDPALCAHELDPPPRFEVPAVPRIIRKWEDVDELRISDEGDSNDPGNAPTMLDADNILVVFSLNERITPQWKRVKAKLVARQRESEQLVGNPAPGSPKSSAWVPALQAWDAEVSEPDLPKTKRAEILYGESNTQANQKYADHLKTAKDLIVTKGYRNILRRTQ